MLYMVMKKKLEIGGYSDLYYKILLLQEQLEKLENLGLPKNSHSKSLWKIYE